MVVNDRIFLVPYLLLINLVILDGLLIPSGFISSMSMKQSLNFYSVLLVIFQQAMIDNHSMGEFYLVFCSSTLRHFVSYSYRFCVLNQSWDTLRVFFTPGLYFCSFSSAYLIHYFSFSSSLVPSKDLLFNFTQEEVNSRYYFQRETFEVLFLLRYIKD